MIDELSIHVRGNENILHVVCNDVFKVGWFVQNIARYTEFFTEWSMYFYAQNQKPDYINRSLTNVSSTDWDKVMEFIEGPECCHDCCCK